MEPIGAPALYANIPIVNIKNDMKAEKVKEFDGVNFNKKLKEAKKEEAQKVKAEETMSEMIDGIETEKETKKEEKKKVTKKAKKQTQKTGKQAKSKEKQKELETENEEENEDDDDDVTFDDLLKAAEEEDNEKVNEGK